MCRYQQISSLKCQCSCFFVIEGISPSQFTCIIIFILICELYTVLQSLQTFLPWLLCWSGAAGAGKAKTTCAVAERKDDSAQISDDVTQGTS